MLRQEIEDAKLTIPQQNCFRQLLIGVADKEGRIGTMEKQYIQHLFDQVDGQFEVAEIESLWKHSEVVLKAAITVAVLSGRYPIDQARRISKLAQQFGFSAKRLRNLEDQALRAIQFRGQQMNMDVTHTLTEVLSKDGSGKLQGDSVTDEVSYSDFMQGLWQSDADLIQHTQHTAIEWEDSDDETS